MFAVKVVTGGSPGATEYDEEVVLRLPNEAQAFKEAQSLPGTKDIFHEHPTRDAAPDALMARVHVDGGIDYYVNPNQGRCASCGGPYTEEAGPRYPSAIPGMCLACVVEHFDADHWVECFPADEDGPPAKVRLTDGREFDILLYPEDEATLLASPEVEAVTR